jgi:hypothetical protein
MDGEVCCVSARSGYLDGVVVPKSPDNPRRAPFEAGVKRPVVRVVLSWQPVALALLPSVLPGVLPSVYDCCVCGRPCVDVQCA